MWLISNGSLILKFLSVLSVWNTGRLECQKIMKVCYLFIVFCTPCCGQFCFWTQFPSFFWGLLSSIASPGSPPALVGFRSPHPHIWKPSLTASSSVSLWYFFSGRTGLIPHCLLTSSQMWLETFRVCLLHFVYIWHNCDNLPGLFNFYTLNSIVCVALLLHWCIAASATPLMWWNLPIILPKSFLSTYIGFCIFFYVSDIQ